jgi:peptidoglycan hydrolase CwlO-like protein
MKTYQWIGSLIASVIIAFPTVASAGPLANRLHNQDQRIYNGTKNGSLTYQEYQRLEKRADAIQAQRARDIRDGGGLTAYESLKLDRKLDRQSHRIYQQKHD